MKENQNQTDISSLKSNEPLRERKEYLKVQAEKLQFICNRLNPYEPIPDYLKKDLRQIGLGELLEGSYDPFALTNKLIMLTENTLEELELYQND